MVGPKKLNMQKNWIGKSFGCEIDFNLINEKTKINGPLLGQIQFLVQVLSLYHWIILIVNFITSKNFLNLKMNVIKLELLKKL